MFQWASARCGSSLSRTLSKNELAPGLVGIKLVLDYGGHSGHLSICADEHTFPGSASSGLASRHYLTQSPRGKGNRRHRILSQRKNHSFRRVGQARQTSHPKTTEPVVAYRRIC